MLKRISIYALLESVGDVEQAGVVDMLAHQHYSYRQLANLKAEPETSK